MEPIDQEALQRALDMALESKEYGRADQVQWMLHEHGWLFAGRFRSFHPQVTQLKLKPWDRPPCRLEKPDDSPAGRLLARMLAAGMSKHDPNPLTALEGASNDTAKGEDRVS